MDLQSGLQVVNYKRQTVHFYDLLRVRTASAMQFTQNNCLGGSKSGLKWCWRREIHRSIQIFGLFSSILNPATGVLHYNYNVTPQWPGSASRAAADSASLC